MVTLRASLKARALQVFAGYTLLILVYAMWVMFGGPSLVRIAFAQLFVLAVRVAVVMLARAASANLSPSPSFRSWRYFAVAFSLWALTDSIVLLFLLLGREPPGSPSILDWLRFAGYFSALAGVISYPSKPPERFGRLRDLMDVSILIAASLVLSWLVFVRAALEIETPILVYWNTAPLVFDLIMLILTVRIALLGAARPDGHVFTLLGFSFSILYLSDLASGYLAVGTSSRPGSLVEAGWMLAGLSFAAAAYQFLRPRIGPRASPLPGWYRRVGPRFETVFPIAFAYLVVGLTAFDWRFSGKVDGLGLGSAVVISLFLVARQGLIAGQFEMRQYATLFNTSTDLAFICDGDGRLRLLNPALRNAIGRRRTPELELNLKDFLVAGQSSEEVLATAMEGDWAGEVSFQDREGSIFPVSLSLRPVYDERRGKTVIAATGYDLTHVKQREGELESALGQLEATRTELEALNLALEEKVRERTLELQRMIADLARLNEELTELDRLKTEFVTLVSHELRAPLTNIRTGIELLLDGTSTMTEEVKDYLRMVHSETERLTRFVEAILDLSALEAGRFPLEIHRLDIEALIRGVVGRLPRGFVERLQLEFPDRFSAVEADSQALSSALFHVIDNAVKYAPDGPVRVRSRVEGDMVRVEVIDQGPGIPPEQRERVFEPFHRLDASDSREVYGHGLGLHLCKRMLEAMGGRVSVDDAPDGGAQVILWLPRSA